MWCLSLLTKVLNVECVTPKQEMILFQSWNMHSMNIPVLCNAECLCLTKVSPQGKSSVGSGEVTDPDSDTDVSIFWGVGTDMNEGQLMGDFEIESKQLEAESWSRIVDSKFLKQQKKDVVKRQEVIYGETLPLLC